MKKNLLIVIFLIISKTANCQSNIGFQFGLLFSLGTTVNNIGIAFNTFYTYQHLQLNLRIGGQYNFIGLGPSLPGKEFQLSFGPQYCYGKADSIIDDYMFSTGNQTGRKNSIGYYYNVYLDQNKTTQTTGTIAIQFDKLELISENDIFGKSASDKFRTAAFKVMYRIENTVFGLNTILWTGDPKGIQTNYDPDYKGRFGYKNLSQNQYGTFSNGICSFQLQQLVPYGGVLKADIGIDSEYIRYAIQDIFIHDMYFLPKKWNNAKNPHYPMLDTIGQPYLFKPGQKVKPSTFYFELSGNTGIFY